MFHLFYSKYKYFYSPLECKFLYLTVFGKFKIFLFLYMHKKFNKTQMLIKK